MSEAHDTLRCKKCNKELPRSQKRICASCEAGGQDLRDQLLAAGAFLVAATGKLLPQAKKATPAAQKAAAAVLRLFAKG